MVFNPGNSVFGSGVVHREAKEERSQAQVGSACMHLLLRQAATWNRVEPLWFVLFCFWLHRAARGILVLPLGIEPGPRQWAHGRIITGMQGIPYFGILGWIHWEIAVMHVISFCPSITILKCCKSYDKWGNCDEERLTCLRCLMVKEVLGDVIFKTPKPCFNFF